MKYLPRFVLLLLLFPLSHEAARAQRTPSPLVLSERVGEEIGPEERTYFGLFPEVDGFASATARPLTDSTVIFAVTRLQSGHARDTLLVYKRTAVDELRRYLDRFEQIYQNTTAVAWGLLLPLAQPVKPFREGAPLTVIRRDGTRSRGRLLYIDERGLVLSDAETVLDRLTDPEAATLHVPDEIKHIRDERPLRQRAFGELEIIGAGNDGVYLNYTMPKLRRHAAFPAAPSPEIATLIHEEVARRQREGREVVTSAAIEEAYLKQFTSRLHFSLDLSPPVALRQFKDQDPASPVRSTVPVVTDVAYPLLSVKVDYHLTERLRVGSSLRYAPAWIERGPFKETHGFVGEEGEGKYFGALRSPGRAQIAGVYFSGLLTFVLRPFDQFSYMQGLSPARVVELRAAAGPSYALLSAHSNVKSAYSQGSSFILYGDTFTDRVGVLGGTVLLEGDLFLTRHLSAGLSAYVSTYDKIHTPSHTLPLPEGVLYGDKTIEELSSTLTVGGLAIGIRLHI